MKKVPRRSLALTAASLLLACAGGGGQAPGGGGAVENIGSTPPARPSGPVSTNPPGVPTSPSSGMGGAGGTRPPDGGVRRDAASTPDVPAAPACTMTVTAMGNGPLIDDFNDNNVALPATDGRMGTWEVSHSETAMIMGAPMDRVPELTTIMGTNRGLRLRGNEPNAMSQWAGEMAVTFAPDCYDASAYGGIQLQIRGLAGTRVEVAVLTASVRAQNAVMQVGGHYHFPVSITSATTFQTVNITWDMFQPGWGMTPGPKVDPKLVYGLAVVTALRPAPAAPTDGGAAPTIGAFDYTIDNVRFMPK